jgi:hypothetical protein
VLAQARRESFLPQVGRLDDVIVDADRHREIFHAPLPCSSTVRRLRK